MRFLKLGLMVLNFAAGFGRDHRVNDEEWQWIGFEYLDREMCLRGGLCGGGLQCGFGNSVAPDCVSSSSQAFVLCCHVKRWPFHRGCRGTKSKIF